jgi:L-ascorbate metabolism protein UlaG (beta-lactamase superfamily)
MYFSGYKKERTKMEIRRLQWAGAVVESEQNNVRILIDPVYKSPHFSFFGEPREDWLPLNDLGDIQVVLVTHLHSDHFDPEVIIQNFGVEIPVLVPKGMENEAKERGLLNVKGMAVGDLYELNGVKIFGSYSVDGLGDEQVSWIIKDNDQTVIHSGDTLWHGYWWKMAKEYGPITAALLPVNGAVVREDGDIPSDQPICLTPEQAVSAAKVLKAGTLIPIHYGYFHNPPVYLETEDLEERLLDAAKRNKISVNMLKHNEKISI